MNTTLSEINERLAELEMRFAFQDDVVTSLNPQVATQERRIIDIAEELRQLRREVTQLRAALGHDIGDEPPPPHY
ncbi:MAG: SlyX family protein [Rhodanobacteraceae bacterium]|jgi:SlyX protein|nr:SlyX family protein [Rhodanobacteraceae bacterium]MBL0042137.1 SlyX family protein [Xanthomonadales bacterium]MBP6077637.1 SlyX family protein [Xanthomonadales bacterium]MBP7624376.1 SlyX family protein [Xanthomonadales bacterium]